MAKAMTIGRLFALAVALSLCAVACGRDGRTAPGPGDQPLGKPASSQCVHAACGNNYFVDTEQVGSCAVGAKCEAALTLVAVGAYHINDEYPYKFIAEAAPGVTYRGLDGAGANVFSKAAGNWSQRDEKTGAMTAAFTPSDRSAKKLSGTFKFSVCSAQNCQLEHVPVAVALAVE